MAARVRLRGVSDEEGNRLLRMVRRISGSVVTWRRAQMPAPLGGTASRTVTLAAGMAARSSSRAISRVTTGRSS